MQNEMKFEITVRQEPDYYRIEIIQVGESFAETYRMALESERFDPRDAQVRRFALDNVYFNLGHALRGRQFPQDTIICDTVADEHGTRSTNPRFPDEAVAA